MSEELESMTQDERAESIWSESKKFVKTIKENTLADSIFRTALCMQLYSGDKLNSAIGMLAAAALAKLTHELNNETNPS